MGANAILAIAPYFTSEDSITFCSGSEDFGMMRVSVLRSHRAVAKKRGTDTELIEHPMLAHAGRPKVVGLRGECDYSKLGADGLPVPGTWMKNNDVLIGRTGKMHEVGPDGELREVRRDRSVVLHCDPSELHVVDRVLVSENKDGNRLIRVTTRSTRRLQCGDKVCGVLLELQLGRRRHDGRQRRRDGRDDRCQRVHGRAARGRDAGLDTANPRLDPPQHFVFLQLSSRHGQKGTVGTLVRPEDMPFVAEGPNAGMRPDVIINLQVRRVFNPRARHLR